VLATVAALAPFLNKAFHIDDPLFPLDGGANHAVPARSIWLHCKLGQCLSGERISRRFRLLPCTKPRNRAGFYSRVRRPLFLVIRSRAARKILRGPVSL